MDIYLSVNNRADILKIPVLPSQFTISKPQSTETFETVSHGELMLIGSPKLKSISISSFFPIRDYPYLRDKSMKGWEYVYKIDTWIDLKLQRKKPSEVDSLKITYSPKLQQFFLPPYLPKYHHLRHLNTQ